MAKQFDKISRYLLGFDTVSWARFLGFDTDQAELSNADFSTVTSQADAVMLLGHDRNRAAHVEIQASYDPAIGVRVLLYYALGVKTLGLPLESYLVLLRPAADGPGIDGRVRHVRQDGVSVILDFNYTVIRVWQEDAEKLIESGLGILPLAFIADIDPAKLPRLVKRAEERLEREATPGTIGEFWTSIDVLMGLKYQRPFVAQLLKGVRTMKESVTYQGILEEGEARGEARGEERGALRGRRDSLLRIGAKRFGPADAATQAVIEAIESADRFDDLLDRVLIASNWAELLAK